MFGIIESPFALVGLAATGAVVYLVVAHKINKAVAEVKDLFSPAVASAAAAHASAAQAHASAADAHASVKAVTPAK